MRQSRNNNGRARAGPAKFLGNAANERRSLLDDLRFNRSSTKDQQLTRKERKDASSFRESTACKIQLDSHNSYKAYIDGRPLSFPLHAFCGQDDPEPWRATKSHSRGIPGPLEAIPVCAPGADRGSAWLPRKCSMRNSNGFNPTKIRVPLESTISESHSRENGKTNHTLRSGSALRPNVSTAHNSPT